MMDVVNRLEPLHSLVPPGCGPCLRGVPVSMSFRNGEGKKGPAAQRAYIPEAGLTLLTTMFLPPSVRLPWFAGEPRPRLTNRRVASRRLRYSK
jgi:hypothetical protein